MTFTSLHFLGFVLAAAFVVQFARGGLRLALIIAASAAFAASWIPGWQAALPLVAFALAGYGAVLLAARARTGAALGLTVAALIAAFVWLKHYPFVAALPVLPFAYTVVGLSYILFRILHLVFEIAGGALAVPPFGRYIAYLFFFPAFLSGPINRYEPFARDLDAPAPLDGDAAFETVWRLLKGLVKVAIVGELLNMAQGSVAARLDLATAAPVAAALYAAAAALYLLFLYANFSGYTDMAIAIGRMFGIVLPENFDKPFMAANFQDFWSRWHITLSEWFKVYFFNPLLKAMMRRVPAPAAAPYLGVAALFVVFVVLGAWHGASWEYMLVGVLLATGVAANKLYQVEITRRLGKKAYRALAARPFYVWGARGLALGWCALSLTPFWRSVGEIAALAARLGPFWIAVALVVMSAAYAAGVFVVVRAARLLRREAAPRPLPRAAALVATMLLLAIAVPLIGAQAEFVYKAF